MVKDAEAHAEDDRRMKEDQESIKRVDALTYSVEQTVKELGDKIPSDLRNEVDTKVEEAKKAIDSNDVEAVKRCEQGLNDVAHKVSEIAYSINSDSPSNGTSNSTEEAEYEVDDD